jgi:hypothetical protein
VKFRYLLAAFFVAAHAGAASGADRDWENPVFETADEAVAAAKSNLYRLNHDSPAGLRLFVDLTLAGGDIDGGHRSSSITREVVEGLIFTHPTTFVKNDVQRRTIDRFLDEVPRQQGILEDRLARFGYPELPGMAYCRLVESVDAFADLGRASTDKMSQVGGVTYFCRYMVLPLSYVGQANLAELRRSAARNPSIDVNETVRRWQGESFANLVNTFRHELVHVHTNSALDVPLYRHRSAYPRWFHEGTATYLAGDPHSALSSSYQTYQDVFFYLAQRYGVRKLQDFYASTLGGSSVTSALAEVYEISGSEQLFARSGRWHRTTEVIKTAFWIVALIIVVAALRGSDRPYIGALQLLVALGLGFAVATGLVEHIYGLRGPVIVTVGKLGFALLAVAFGFRGARRIQRHRQSQISSA